MKCIIYKIGRYSSSQTPFWLDSYKDNKELRSRRLGLKKTHSLYSITSLRLFQTKGKRNAFLDKVVFNLIEFHKASLHLQSFGIWPAQGRTGHSRLHEQLVQSTYICEGQDCLGPMRWWILRRFINIIDADRQFLSTISLCRLGVHQYLNGKVSDLFTQIAEVFRT